MLRRPLTILSITPEDIADYEDRLAEKARFQARFIARRDREERRSLGAPISAPSHPSGLGGTARRRVIPSSSPSPPPLAQHPQQPEEESEEEEEEVSYYARAQHQARQVSLSFQGQQTPGQQFDGQEDEDVEMMSAPPLPPSTGVPPQTRLQARMGMGVGMGEQMETPSIVRAQPQRRSARERSREVESQQQRDWDWGWARGKWDGDGYAGDEAEWEVEGGEDWDWGCSAATAGS
ncbi:hypothetical protein QBC36DRAFT_358025 [Triangularia setosa]|uniref:Uncharacterized protein n=1 Tax=Triangularia setosa TaxID=2587417 RepID=A0AAN7A4Z1_9PEZI|nr:hypothetical protein QBC36DRAFT_358025 [Podospora setosa]